MSTFSTPMRRYLVVALVVLVILLVLFPAPAAFACGCGTADHTWGSGPGFQIHYYWGQYISQGALIVRWRVVSGGGIWFNDVWCGCVSYPCVYSPQSADQ